MQGPIIRNLCELAAQSPSPLVLYVNTSNQAVLYSLVNGVYRVCRHDVHIYEFDATNIPLNVIVIDGFAYFIGSSGGGGNPTSIPYRVAQTDSAGNLEGTPNWFQVPNALWRGPGNLADVQSIGLPSIMLSEGTTFPNILWPNNINCAMAVSSTIDGSFGFTGNYHFCNAINCRNISGNVFNSNIDNVQESNIMVHGNSTLETVAMSNIVLRDGNVNFCAGSSVFSSGGDINEISNSVFVGTNLYSNISPTNDDQIACFGNGNTSTGNVDCSIIGNSNRMANCIRSTVIGRQSTLEGLQDKVVLSTKGFTANSNTIPLATAPLCVLADAPLTSTNDTATVWSRLRDRTVCFNYAGSSSSADTTDYIAAMNSSTPQRETLDGYTYLRIPETDMATNFNLPTAETNTIDLRQQVSALIGTVKALTAAVIALQGP